MSTATGWTTFWETGRWWKALLAAFGYMVLFQLAGLVIGTVAGGLVDRTDVFATPASVFVALGAGLAVGAVILVVFLLSVGWLRPLFGRQPVPGRWWMYIFVAIAVIPIVLRFIGIDYGRYADGVVITTLFVGLLIGFTEEVLYRGIVIEILRRAGHRELTVAVLSSLFFALSHAVNLLSGQPVLTVGLTMVFTFGFGMVMYLVLRATGHLIFAVLIHGLTDPTTFLATGAIDSSTGGAHSAALDLAAPFNIVFVVAGLVALFLIRGRVVPATPDTVVEPRP